MLVLYERGDTEQLYHDLPLRSAMSRLNYAIVWAHECNAKSTGDLQADASRGPARMLFAALEQLAVKSAHPELASVGLVVYGFSAAGVLAATLENSQSARLLGAIQYAAGSAHLDLDDITVSAAASKVPTLILANAADTQSGTARCLHYFERGRALGASWAYGVQSDTSHCCNLSTRNVILPWIEDVARSRTATLTGQSAYFTCTPDGVEDAQDNIDCQITAAALGEAAPQRKTPVGFLVRPRATHGCRGSHIREPIK